MDWIIIIVSSYDRHSVMFGGFPFDIPGMCVCVCSE